LRGRNEEEASCFRPFSDGIGAAFSSHAGVAEERAGEDLMMKTDVKVWPLLAASVAVAVMTTACGGAEPGRLGTTDAPPPLGPGQDGQVPPPAPPPAGSPSLGDVDDGAAPPPGPSEEVDTSGENYAEWTENDWVDTDEEATSTFSADVDTASYSLARRNLNADILPEPASVRVEEFLNYFRYDEPAPTDGSPFAVQLEVAPSPFGPSEDPLHLMRIGIQGEQIPYEERDPVNLVFLIDVSGSMQSTAKLPLVKYTLRLLVDKLAPTDTLGIVVYAGADGVVLEPTPVINKSEILDAIDSMSAGGGTNGEAGIRAAYDLAEGAFRTDGVNRVVLASDGDFNIGATGEELYTLIEDFRERDIFLSYFGYGSGNYNDETAEELTNRGNGNYAYIDSNNEALRIVGENLVSTLQVIAKDVKLQVEFDPARVERYRLIGYENRLLNNEDFIDDSVDAGDLGAGHHVTALYEIDLRDDAKAAVSAGTATADPIATLRIRHKKPTGDISEEQSTTVDLGQTLVALDAASTSFKWAAAVAEFAEILRDSMHVDVADFDAVRALAEQGELETPAHAEFIGLVDKAATLSGED
jgi:Ca-activated chloride channel family protein